MNAKKKNGAVPNCVGFIEGFVTGTSKVVDILEQSVMEDGHKC